MPELSPSLIQDVLSGDPSAAAELQRIQEGEVRGQFRGPREGFLSKVMSRALLGRSRSPSTALTREEERLLEQSRPDLRYSSAAASPEKTYPGSRLATTPAIAALPAAGVGAGIGYLAGMPTDLPSWAKSLITAGAAGVGGVAGSTAAHVMRQRHARALRREGAKEACLVEQLVPYASLTLEKHAISLGWLDDLLRGAGKAVPKGVSSVDDAARGITSTLASEVRAGLAAHPESALDLAALQRNIDVPLTRTPFVPIPGVSGSLIDPMYGSGTLSHTWRGPRIINRYDLPATASPRIGNILDRGSVDPFTGFEGGVRNALVGTTYDLGGLERGSRAALDHFMPQLRRGESPLSARALQLPGTASLPAVTRPITTPLPAVS